jgi:hypothetical protein
LLGCLFGLHLIIFGQPAKPSISGAMALKWNSGAISCYSADSSKKCQISLWYVLRIAIAALWRAIRALFFP